MTHSAVCTNAEVSRLRYRFTGKERDSESGNDYFGARYYASSMGRWLSPDWSNTPEAVPYADLEDPQSLNLYQYAANNPLVHIDANGHCWSWIQGVCNFFQRVIDKTLLNNGWRTFKEVRVAKREWVSTQVTVPEEKDWVLHKATDKQISAAFNYFKDPMDQANVDALAKVGIALVTAAPDGDISGAQDKKLTSTEIQNLEKNTGETAHEIKEGALGTNKNISRYDLYKNSQGEIVAKPKGSSGAGEPTGYTTEHLRTPEE